MDPSLFDSLLTDVTAKARHKCSDTIRESSARMSEEVALQAFHWVVAYHLVDVYR